MSGNRGLRGQPRHGLSRPAQAFYHKLNCEGLSDGMRGDSLSNLDHSIDTRQASTCCSIKPERPQMVAQTLRGKQRGARSKNLGARRLFGGPRLPNGSIILTKLPACLNPAFSYTNALAEPRHMGRNPLKCAALPAVAPREFMSARRTYFFLLPPPPFFGAGAE